MQAKLQELTDKIYQEGVSKAKEESEHIISNAKHTAADIIKDANKEAEGIIKEAEKKSEEMRQNVQSEMKLAAQQLMSKLKQEISDIITAELVDDPLKKGFNDVDFIKSLVTEVVKGWSKDNAQTDLSVLLSKEYEQKMDDYVKSKGMNKLNAEFDIDIESGFKVGPKDGGFKISFTEKGFENFFKEYLRPKVNKYLFGGE